MRLKGARPYAKQELIGKSYDAFARPALPNALAKVVDEKSALRFARVYGLPDYASFIRAEEENERAYGREDRFRELRNLAVRWHARDPLDWVFAQARSVRFVLELLEALSHGASETASVLRKYRLPAVDSGTDGPRSQTSLTARFRLLSDAAPPGADEGRWHFSVAFGPTIRPEFEVETVVGTDDRRWFKEDNPIVRAHALVEELVNRNTKNVRWEIRACGERPFRFWHNPVGLIEVIWWHVQAAAVSGDARKIALCQLPSCGAPFIRTDGRQRFCPADFASKKSRCAALYQKRKSRGIP
jgi:hypothetical protein